MSYRKDRRKRSNQASTGASESVAPEDNNSVDQTPSSSLPAPIDDNQPARDVDAIEVC